MFTVCVGSVFHSKYGQFPISTLQYNTNIIQLRLTPTQICIAKPKNTEDTTAYCGNQIPVTKTLLSHCHCPNHNQYLVCWKFEQRLCQLVHGEDAGFFVYNTPIIQ